MTIELAGAKSIDARITRISLKLDSQSRTLLTETDIDNSDLKLLPGAYVTAKILLEERVDVLTLPITAIVKTATETVCCRVVDGKIQHQPIELGLRVGDNVQVLSGLDGSETVVLVRASGLQRGRWLKLYRLLQAYRFLMLGRGWYFSCCIAAQRKPADLVLH